MKNFFHIQKFYRSSPEQREYTPINENKEKISPELEKILGSIDDIMKNPEKRSEMTEAFSKNMREQMANSPNILDTLYQTIQEVRQQKNDTLIQQSNNGEIYADVAREEAKRNIIEATQQGIYLLKWEVMNFPKTEQEQLYESLMT